MRINAAGYLRPSFPDGLSQEDDHRIGKICPGIYLRHQDPSSNHHPLWGPVVRSQVGHARDEEVRKNGSSGGVLSALALYLIESGEVDFVLQIAADPASALRNTAQTSRSRADVLRAAGSRYAPAAPLDRIGEHLSSGQRFAVIGKPCDIAALRNLATMDPRVNAQVPYMLSFMCAGVPSVHGTHEMLKAMGISADEVVSLRYRGDGWPGNARAVTQNGKSAEMDYPTSWGTILNRHLQFRCKICPDGTGEFADITCADAWHGENGYPDFSEREGQSLILARTAAGVDLLSRAERQGAIARHDLPIEQIASMQPYQKARKESVFGRLLAVWARQGWAPRFHQLGIVRASLRAFSVGWIKGAIGTYRRANGEKQ